MQEIGYAKEATVYCGNAQVEWRDLADAVALFASRASDISDRIRKDPGYNYQIDYLGDLGAQGATRLVDTASKLFRRSKKGSRPQPLLSLEALVSKLSTFKTSDPHDIIYSVLSLANDTMQSSASEATISATLSPTAPDRESKRWPFSNKKKQLAKRVINVLASNRTRKLFPHRLRA